MSFFSLLGAFFIGPLKLLFEVIYAVAYDVVGSPGVAIIFLSLAMNILVLPLYRRADAMQEKARDTEAALKRGVTHIKKTFSGNERMMMLQTYYRQNNYSPVNALKGSVSLLLEIPFFMAAYQFLSHLGLLSGVPFGPIADLSAPDGLLKIGSLTLNLLPILMTVINFVSAAIYLKGFPLKTKIQLYGMAVFFLFFLYASPSGLVFYWTLNNVFSLVKNIFYKIKDPGGVIALISEVCSAVCIILFAFAEMFGEPRYRNPIVLIVGIALLIPPVRYFIRSKIKMKKLGKEPRTNRRTFILASVFLTVFIGVLIPSAYVASSPQEFIDVSDFFHPLWYVAKSGFIAAGTFILWFGVFYWLASPRGKAVFEKVLTAFCFVAVVDYMFFGRQLGVVSSDLTYESDLFFEPIEWVVNIICVIVLCVLVPIALSKWGRVFGAVLLAGSLAVSVMAGVNVASTARSVSRLDSIDSEDFPRLTISKNGRNVVVVMLDRAMGEMFPYILSEKPELRETFDGFTYYSNVISYGGHTNMAAPALLGGYEYTPVEMNRRDTEKLVDKHDEALKVLPVLFSDAGYSVTVCDPPYAGYQWIPDISIYDDYPSIRKFITKGRFKSKADAESSKELLLRNFFCFSIMKSTPIPIELLLYDSGSYHSASDAESLPAQTCAGLSLASGSNQLFLDSYNVLTNLDSITHVTDDGNTFLFLGNETTHEPTLLKEPEYEVAAEVDNTLYDSTHQSRFSVDGKVLHVNTNLKMRLYHVNMAALLRLGEWFDFLREKGVYDNTRIIVISDHGYFARTSSELDFRKDSSRGDVDGSSYFPLMLVKDFDAHGFEVCDDFMTNADMPLIALGGVTEDPVNPFTGNPLTSDEKTAHEQFIMTYHEWSASSNNGNTFTPATWASVKDNIWDRDNWEFFDDEIVLKEHAFPKER